MSHRALLAAAGAQGKLYSEDVFSAFTYTGNGSTQTITNGIDLTKGGLVWGKSRSATGSNELTDTVRGATRNIYSNLAVAESASSDLTSFTSSGYGLSYVSGNQNANGATYASWTFRRAPKFFDVVTWTGDGTSNRQIPHALGIAPGMVTAKRRDSTGDWAVWHRSATGDLYLDTTAAQTGSFTQITAASATTFSVSGNANINGATYVACAWAHDPDTVNGIVQCGSFTTDASGNGSANLGWEPQYLMYRRLNAIGDWTIVDTSRGFSLTSALALGANTSAAETTGTLISPNASGFGSSGLGFSSTYFYLAIRRGPMRTPTSGASVYNAIARTGTGAAATVTGVGFAPDLVLEKNRNIGDPGAVKDRLRGAKPFLVPSATSVEDTTSDTDGFVSFGMDGFNVGADSSTTYWNFSSRTYIAECFRRAPGFFDIVCDAGTGAAHTITHNLGAAPGLVIRKGRSGTTQWEVWHSALANTQKLVLNSSAAVVTDATAWNSTSPTSTNFSVGTDANLNTSAATYATYLFGALAGVSSIGSYTGNGATQTINCGFASGARFVLIKRTDSTGDWLVLDTVRGIISGNDPYITLDTTAAEVTTADLLTPQSVGFGLTSNALVNASGGTFLYFAVA